MKPMTVAELIEFLKKQPQDLPVAFCLYSEYSLLHSEQIGIQHLCPARVDGWVHDARPDKEVVSYLVFPGN